jgi:hypothetical protein
MTRTDKFLTLYGPNSVYGRMSDLHLPKSCVDFDWDELGNVPDNHPNAKLVNIKPAARNDKDGSFFNDKRAISPCIIGQVNDIPE